MQNKEEGRKKEGKNTNQPTRWMQYNMQSYKWQAYNEDTFMGGQCSLFS